MSDNLFDRLFELFQTSDAVNWALADEIVKSLAGEREPIEPHLAEEYQELSLAAQLQLSSAGALDPARSTIPHPIDGAGWARANVRAYAYLMEPLAGALGAGVAAPGNPLGAALGPLGPALAGLQAGSMVGGLGAEVLGQFDAPLPPLDQTKAYLVVPNVESLARDHDLDERQVRRWAIMHELVNHEVRQFPAVRAGFAGAVSEVVDGMDFDPARLMEKLGRLQDPEALEGLLEDSDGISALLGGDRSGDAAAALRTLAAFIEGYGDRVVSRAAGSLLPQLGAIEGAHSARRHRPQEAVQQLASLVGNVVDRSEARAAADFCDEVERRWGAEAMARLWEDTDHLPRAGELTDPIGWAARVLLD